MTKSELIEAVASRMDMPRKSAETVVNVVFETITDALVQGEGIEIRGFGSLTVRSYRGYSGRNPKTGEPVEVSSKRLPFFRAGKEMKQQINQVPRVEEKPATSEPDGA